MAHAPSRIEHLLIEGNALTVQNVAAVQAASLRNVTALAPDGRVLLESENSQQILSQNGNRIAFWIGNAKDKRVFFGFNTPALVGKGIFIGEGGSILLIGTSSEALNVIADGGDTDISWQEFVSI